jgi:hypothetical protein
MGAGTGERVTETLYWRRSGKTGNLFLRAQGKDTRSRAVVYQRPDGTFGWKGSGHDDGQTHPTEEAAIEAVWAAIDPLGM